MQKSCTWLGLLLLVGGVARGQSGCKELAKLQLANTVMTEAVEVAAGTPVRVGAVEVTSLPAHCLVRGEVNKHVGAEGKEYGDRFEVRMPDAWQGRVLFVGGGGLDGIVNPAVALQGQAARPDSRSALAMGYAVVTSDGGHEAQSFAMGDGAFGADPGARDDYNYLSTKRVMDVARELVKSRYGSAVQHAYFAGCSNGGREGLMTAERYPKEFDGVVAGAPAFNLTHAAIAEAWNTDQLASLLPKDGSPDLSKALTGGDLNVLVSALLDRCDALDGLKDGLITNPEACHFDPAVTECAAGQSAGCLAPEKVRVVKAMFGGPKNSKGEALYSPWAYDAGIAAEGWRVWVTGLGGSPSVNVMIFPSFFNGLALPGAQPKVDILHFDFDRDAARLEGPAKEINADSTDWSGYRAHGGKLLLYTGMSDPVFSALDLIRYYKQVVSANGGQKQEFARLFLVPGMNHCSGGPALDDFDALGAIQRWVESGVAPESMLSTGTAFPGRSRPLCAYPRYAMYDGHGSPEKAESFHCVVQ